ncbi:hypothetical protein B0T14DRAFT_331722 [Immersiella caudata]|uniref:BZIP domain-containing protein n=1 Tax=Immersiella caudata TaxID=314043 RepID=A0AA39W4G8_9PEZI|nr:hypothetical protein B0T14DRAFT_331722 [Immersiella caudata]
MPRKTKTDNTILQNRESQRRSRARRRELVEDLQRRVAEYERRDAHATEAMQLAARKVVEENRKLRELLGRCVCAVGEEFRSGEDAGGGVEAREDVVKGVGGEVGGDRRGEVEGAGAKGESAMVGREMMGVSVSESGEELDPRLGRGEGDGGREVVVGVQSGVAVQGVMRSERPAVVPSCSDLPGCCGNPPQVVQMGVVGLDRECEITGERESAEERKQDRCRGFGKEGCCADEEVEGKEGQCREKSTSTSLETSCEEAVSILKELHKVRHVDTEQVRAALGCQSAETCLVKNTRLFQVMDELS